MGNFEEAKKFNGAHPSNDLDFQLIPTSFLPTGLLIEKEPTNMQALSLGQLIDQGVTRGSCTVHIFPFILLTPNNVKEGYIGMALAGSIVAVGAIVVGSLIRRAARK